MEMNLQLVSLSPSTKVLIDRKLEYARFNRASALLSKFGRTSNRNKFDRRFEVPEFGTRCFDAAFKMAEDHGMIYVEGVMFLGPRLGTLLHAWCELPDGSMFDPINQNIQHKENIEYFGIRFDLGYARRWQESTGYHGLLDGHKNGASIGVYHDNPEEFLWKGI